MRAILGLTVDTLAQVVSGRRSIEDFGGPIRIAKTSGEQASLGWAPFIGFVALLSINLGFINLLPIPMLDGGHLLFYAIEAVLYEIQCQNCEERFLVAGHARAFWDSSEIADGIRTHRLHYGDPPWHDCTGDTINCIDLRVIEYWRKNDDHEWTGDEGQYAQLYCVP